jgi:hypothetical protein
MSEEIDYNKLRLDIIQKMIDERNIICKNKKDEMIKYLIMDDLGKYIRETIYEKEKGGFIVGIDIRNQKEILQISKLIEKKEAKPIGRYCNDRIHYWSNQKLI